MSFRPLLAALATAIVVAGCDPSGSAPHPVVPAEGGPRPTPAPSEGIGTGAGDDLVPVRGDPADPFETRVPLGNDGAERLAPADAAALPGWRASGDCGRDAAGTAAGNGRAHFRLGPGCTLEQTSTHAVRDGDGLSLVLDAVSRADASPTLRLELFGEDAAGQRVLLTRQVTIAEGQGHWRSHQLLGGFDVARAPGDEASGRSELTSRRSGARSGARLGVRLVNESITATIGVDAIALGAHAPDPDAGLRFADDWLGSCDQSWAGEHYWANRLHDWEVRDGRLRTRADGPRRPLRTVHRVATALREAPADFSLTLDTGADAAPSGGSWSGLLVGAGHRLDHRAAALVHTRHGRNGGLLVGIDHEGRAFVHDNDLANRRLANGRPSAASTGATLRLDASLRADGLYSLNVFALDADGEPLSTTRTAVPPERLLGSIALASHPGGGGTTHRFDRFEGFGAKLRELPARDFGPVLFASHTLSRGTLTLNAQYPQGCAERFAEPRLEVLTAGTWRPVASAPIDPLSLTARFVVEDWDDTLAHPYRLATEAGSGAPPAVRGTTAHYHGTVRPDPRDRDELVLASYSCRPGVVISDTEGWIEQNPTRPFTWTRERLVVPHEELVTNSLRHEPDLLAFLGDQIYEFDPNGLPDRQDLRSVVDDYFWKWYQFGWSVREAMRDTPTVIVPDDHDVFQGNVWGEGGRPAATEQEGGFVQPADLVRIVRRTQTGSLPAPFDPAPLEQGLDPYYTDLVYGGVGIAVLEDRTFKTGPHSPAVPRQLLGERQHAFLDSWARDWRGHAMKLVLSQSPFSQSTTHSGAGFDPIGLDHDANGWPRDGRDEAVRALRRAFAPHVTGDQHLGMLLRHGIDAPGDAVHSFAGPSMLNVFPRIWDPRALGEMPLSVDRAMADTGDYRGSWRDRHGNLIDVIAAANPDLYTDAPVAGPHASKDALGIGYGIVRVDKPTRRYTFEAWPANADPDDPLATPYPHWPVEIAQQDNDGRTVAGHLAPRTAAVDTPVVEVVDERSGELVWVRRSPTPDVTLPVPDATTRYRVTLSDPGSDYREVFEAQQVLP